MIQRETTDFCLKTSHFSLSGSADSARLFVFDTLNRKRVAQDRQEIRFYTG
uniref:Uncharacterized protein n=1 Tax=Faecalibaculum rodentium TaxID=1702221 RepID=A0A140DRB8_9FIRM|nr:hypothetical protein AALO17_00610 [Faecalibaculum rodentium]